MDADASLDYSYSTIDIEAFVARFYPGKRVLITPYVYPAIFAALTQGLTLTTAVQIAANADFVFMGCRHRAVVGTVVGQNVSTKPAPMVRMLITDSGTSENYTQGAVDLELYSTNDSKVINLPYPRIVSGRSALTVQVTNFAPAAETYSTLEVDLVGVLVRAYTG